MKKSTTAAQNPMRIPSVMAVFFMLILLTGCAGTTARMDMLMSRANGTINQSEKISAEELYSIICNHFGKVNVKLIDDEYTLPDNGKVSELSENAAVQNNDDPTVSNWDCDDYAIAAMVPLRNYAFGAMYVKTASGRRHAMNVFVNRNREVVYWEPQARDYYRGRFHKPDLIIF